jgi:hypothetical protein
VLVLRILVPFYMGVLYVYYFGKGSLPSGRQRLASLGTCFVSPAQ